MSKLPCGHSSPHDTQATCRVCWLALNDSRYQKLWGLTVTPDSDLIFGDTFVGSWGMGEGVQTEPQQAVGGRDKLCIHLGAKVNIAGQVREWFTCNKGHGIVCPCGLCQNCSDYSPVEEED